jgi:hypothetical protein
MMRIKVECCLTREERRDFEDVKFMILKYSKQVLETMRIGVVDEDELREVLENKKVGNKAVRERLASVVEIGSGLGHREGHENA